MFAPELWGAVDYFDKFYQQTYEFSAIEQRAVTGVKGHFQKAVCLLTLASKLRPGVELDHIELEHQGFTPATNSKELGTVLEATILELYSTIDCTAKVIRAVHGKTTPKFKASTRSLFQDIGRLEGTLPSAIKHAISSATWYWRLLYLRDELTHLTPGNCHLDREKNTVWYINQGVQEGGKPLIIHDVFLWLEEVANQVNRFVGAVFSVLNLSFENTPVFAICGMVQGRVLHRYIRPEGKLTFDSGECGAWVWFEKPELPTCPFVGVCGAYSRKAPPQGWET